MRVGASHGRASLEASAMRAKVVRAARELFLRYGVQRTSMADVAKEVGISRQALYRIVSGSSELVEAVLIERVKEIADEIRPILEEATSLDEVIYRTSVASIENARHDREMHNFFQTSDAIRIHHLMTGHFPEISTIVLDLLQPAFQRARQSGEIRRDVTDEQLVEWYRGVHMMLILREDLEPDEEQEIIRKFLVPSFRASFSYDTESCADTTR